MRHDVNSHENLGVTARTPTHGDVVVREIIADPTGYTTGPVSGPPQARYASRAAAVDAAHRYAQQRQVDCWFTRDDIKFTPLTRHRGTPV